MIGFGVVMGILSAMNLTILMLGIAIPAYLVGVWMFAMLQISIMTTIYGVYIEGRDLPTSDGELA